MFSCLRLLGSVVLRLLRRGFVNWLCAYVPLVAQAALFTNYQMAQFSADYLVGWREDPASLCRHANVVRGTVCRSDHQHDGEPKRGLTRRCVRGALACRCRARANSGASQTVIDRLALEPRSSGPRGSAASPSAPKGRTAVCSVSAPGSGVARRSDRARPRHTRNRRGDHSDGAGERATAPLPFLPAPGRTGTTNASLNSAPPRDALAGPVGDALSFRRSGRGCQPKGPTGRRGPATAEKRG